MHACRMIVHLNVYIHTYIYIHDKYFELCIYSVYVYVIMMTSIEKSLEDLALCMYVCICMYTGKFRCERSR